MNEGSKDQTLAFKLLAFSKRLEACVAGVRRVRERGFWAREKREGRARKEGGKPKGKDEGKERVLSLFSLPLSSFSVFLLPISRHSPLTGYQALNPADKK